MTTENLNIIGDVAGNYKTLMKLLDKMPVGCKTVLVGDLVDRGPNSRKVVQFAKSNQETVVALMGNHEHMLCDFVLSGRPGRGPYSMEDWFVNGGGATVRSYMPNASTRKKEISYVAIQDALMMDAQWLAELPTAYIRKEDRLVVTHAPLIMHPEKVAELTELPLDFVWNRQKPEHHDGWFQVHGHNAVKKPHWYGTPDPDSQYGEMKPWGINIDTSRGGVLTGVHWPTLEIFQQEYVD